jgi:hypothetical protein
MKYSSLQKLNLNFTQNTSVNFYSPCSFTICIAAIIIYHIKIVVLVEFPLLPQVAQAFIDM